MPPLLLPALAIVGSLIGLVFGADRFIGSAATIARRLGVSPLLVGMLIVGLGTSAPEMLVSALAAWRGNAGIAIGNVLGSNVSNIGMVLGASALVAPIGLQPVVVRRELPLLLLISAATVGLFVDSHLGRIDGAVLAAALGLFLFRMLRRNRRTETEDEEEAKPGSEEDKGSLWVSSVVGLAGLALLLVSSQGVVWGASEIARALGVSDLIIGLTIVAIGTSLPELAASIASAFRGQHDLAVGNVIGSNTFNLLAVLPFPAFIDPSPVESDVLWRDFPMMVGLTVALALLALMGFRRNEQLGRVAGALLLAAYLGYLGLLLYQSVTG